MSALELFRCEPYACRLTRAACAERHRSASAPASSSVRGQPSLRWSLCRTCETGAAHARGERPDVDVAALVRREEVEVAGQTYTHGGETLTLAGWAAKPAVAALGLSAQAIRSRVEVGWTVGDALTTPKGSPRPPTSAPTSAPRKSTKPRDEGPRKRPVQRGRKATPEAVQRVAEAIEERAAVPTPTRRRIGDAPAAEQVRETLSALSPADLLTRLGHVVEDAGLVPAGRLLLVRGVV